MPGRFIYRSLPVKEADAILDKCLEQNLDWDIWNAEDMLYGTSDVMEVGFTEEDWQKLGYGV